MPVTTPTATVAVIDLSVMMEVKEMGMSLIVFVESRWVRKFFPARGWCILYVHPL